MLPAIEFTSQQILFRPQAPIALSYKNQRLSQIYVPDFICFDKIVLEIKAVSDLTDKHRDQIHNYLKASSMKLGLLANFGSYPQLEWERIVN